MKVLIVEDSLERIKIFKQKLIGHDVWVAMTARQACDFLEYAGPFDYAFLDHDLGGRSFEPSDKNSGYGVCQWMTEHPDKEPRHITIHSLNNIGSAKMMQVLGDAGIRAKYAPFAWIHLKPTSPKLGNSREIEENTEKNYKLGMG